MTFSQSWVQWCTVTSDPRVLMIPITARHKTSCALRFDFHTDYTSSATLPSPPDLNLSLSAWQHVLCKWHVRVQTHETIHLCLATQSQAALMGFNWRGQGQEQGPQCMMPVICHGKQTRLWCPCDPGVRGSHGSMGFSPLCGHIQAVMSVKGKDWEICARERVHSNQIPLAHHYCHYHHYLHQEQRGTWVFWCLPVENSVMWSFCGGYVNLLTVLSTNLKAQTV